MAGKSRKAGAARKAKAAKPVAKPKQVVAVRDRAAPKPARVKVKLPAKATAADRHEAEQFVLALDRNDQLARQPGPLPPGATHQLQSDGSAPPRLVRKRFSAR
jgi:hypothetical protein